MSDGRREPRVEAQLPVRVRWPGRGAEQTINLSAGGLALQTPEPLNVRTLVSVELALPGGAVNAVGHVRWATGDAMGIAFDDRSEQVAAFLAPAPLAQAS